MIGNISKGGSFLGAVKYVAGEKTDRHDASLLYQNLNTSNSVKAIAQFFEEYKERGNTIKPVLHMSLRPAPSDWEKLKDKPEVCKDIVDIYLEKMGFDSNHPRAVYFHNEPDGQSHWHIITTNVLESGRIWKSSNDQYRSMKACRDIENIYGLFNVSSEPARRKNATKPEEEKYNRTGDISPFEHIKTNIDDIFKRGQVSYTEFTSLLAKAGIEARLNINAAGLTGTSFSYNGIAYKGSKFGKDFSAKGLIARGLVSDAQALENCQAKPIVPIRPIDPPKPARNPEPSKVANADPMKVKEVVELFKGEFWGTAKDKKPTLEGQAEQAISKSLERFDSAHIDKAVNFFALKHPKPEFGRALTKAKSRYSTAPARDPTHSQPYFMSSAAQVDALTLPKREEVGQSFANKGSSSNIRSGTLRDAFDKLSQAEKNEVWRQNNAPRPSLRR